MPRHRKLTQKLVGFPMFHKGTNKYTFSLTHPLTRAFTNVSGAVDPDLAAFIAATGATNTESLSDLVTYLKAENLWTSSRIYPMRSDQNKGSGATVYGLGGLTSNNLSLVNSPTWGASDIDFTVANSYGVASIPAFNNLTQGLVITRFKLAQAATVDGDIKYRWYHGSGVDQRFIGSVSNTGALTGETYSTLQTIPGSNGRTGSSTASWAANEDFTEVCKFGTFPSSAAVYKNKTAFVMDRTASIQTFTPASIGYTANSNVYLSANNNSQLQIGKYTAWGVIGAAVTDTQRETITDLINALGTTGDSDLDAYVAASGATDTEPLFNLVTYLKQQSLWASSRIYPMKAAQNAGSGSIAYGLGGLSTGDVSLVSSPTWGASGIDFNGSTQYGLGPDLVDGSTMMVFSRNNVSATSPGAGGRAMLSTYGGTTNRAFNLAYDYSVGVGIKLFRSPDGAAASQEGYQNSSNSGVAGVDACVVAEWINGGGRSLWINNTAQSLTLFAGSPATSMFNSTLPLTIAAAYESPTAVTHSAMTGIAQMVVRATVTPTQRTALTNLINAL